MLALIALGSAFPAAGSTQTGPAAAADEFPTATLVIELNGMKRDEGALVYAVWSGPSGWLEEGAVRDGAVPVENGASTVVLSGLPYGEYAVSAYHDRNGNGRLDTGLFGIPKEPIGTSNDAKIRFGPPKYEDAVFTVDRAALTIAIVVQKIF